MGFVAGDATAGRNTGHAARNDGRTGWLLHWHKSKTAIGQRAGEGRGLVVNGAEHMAVERRQGQGWEGI